MVLVDSHCHLDRLRGNPPLDEVIREAAEAGVSRILCPGIDMGNAAKVCAIAEQFSSVWASVGIHPLDIGEPVSHEALLQAASHPKVVALGETGLDYYYSTDNKQAQQESLVQHLQVASELGLPVIIHSRDAADDTINLLATYASREHTGVLHCFTGDWEMAQRALDLGFYLSFSGIVTFANAAVLQDVARRAPANRILVETDSPYLAPVPFRGKPNLPKYVRQVAEFVAQLRGESLEDFAVSTTNNFHTLFRKAGR